MDPIPGSEDLNNGGSASDRLSESGNALTADDVASIFSGTDDRNMSSMEWATTQIQLRYSTTGCLREAAVPLPLAPGDFCLDGFYCPNSTGQMPPQYCPPTEACQVSRDHGQLCAPQGFLEPQLCNKGFYCPARGKQQIQCPPGHFCPYGTLDPVKCDLGAYCPTGSIRQIPVLPLGITVVIDCILLSVVLAGLFLVKYTRRKSRARGDVFNHDGLLDGREKRVHDPEWLTNPPAYPTHTHPKPRNFSLPSIRQSQKDIKGILRSSMSQAKQDVKSGVRKVSFSTEATLSDKSSKYSQSTGPSRGSSFRSVFYPEVETKRLLRTQNSMRDRHVSIPDISYWSSHSSWTSPDPSLHGVAYSETFSPHDSGEQHADMETVIKCLTEAIHTQELGLSFQFTDLAYNIKGVGEVLQGVSGNIRQGSMVGVMGSTGAGKSTLLNILMGKKRQSRGTVKVCGSEKDMAQYGKLVGYVPQVDIVLPELTVRENILHSARCRLPKSWKDSYIQRFVDALLACLALEHVQHSLVGDARKPIISGGQRKRLSIGIELAAAPMALFLDEPTTGLDATSAASIMRLLKTISALGTTTIAIIHQPREEIFRAFDSLLLLADGRQLYNGPTATCEGYFVNQGFRFPLRGNPADTIMDIITGDGQQYSNNKSNFETSITTLANYWHDTGRLFKWPCTARKSSITTLKLQKSLPPRPHQSPHEQSSALAHTMSTRSAPWVSQLYFVLLRSLTQQLRTRTSLLLEFFVATLAGLLIGLSAFSLEGHLFHGIYRPPFALFSPAVDNTSSLQLALLTSVAIGLCASAPGVRVFGDEKLLYAREIGAGHSRSAYFVGKQLAMLPRVLVAALHFTACLLVLATPRMTFGEAYVVNLAYYYATYGLASMVSVVVKREDGPLLALLVSLVLGVFGGVAPPLTKVREWGLEWAWRMGPGVWLCEAYWDRIVGGTGGIYILDLAEEATGMKLGRFGVDVVVVFALGTAYRILGFGAMCAADWIKKKRA
ncbi:ABC transporter G family member [Sphaceloma murrayae]|uniref:ABC transporter G family member n=1 Tax=Sphaceloma murrayae TaxID=2082308 RepID=A0A2K1QST9_9PEZI|nr:ABC transporter G family member [Sphaceloma murrayae]